MPSGVSGVETKAFFTRSTTWGNALQAWINDGILILPPSIKRDAAVTPDDSIGTGTGVCLDGAPESVKVEGDLPMYLRYDGLDKLLACFFGSGGLPVQQGATPAYAYSYPFAASLEGVFGTAAVNMKNYIKELGSVKVAGVTLSGEAGKPVKATFRVICQQEVWNSLVNTLASAALVTWPEYGNRVLMQQGVFRLNDQTGAALGSNDVIRPNSFELSIQRKLGGTYGQYRTANGLQDLIDEPAREDLPEIRYKLTFPRHTSNARLLDLANDTAKKADITFTGALISGGYYRTMALQLPNLDPVNAEAPIQAGIIPETLEYLAYGVAAAPAGMTATEPVRLTGINKNQDDPLALLKLHAPLTADLSLIEGVGALTFTRASVGWYPDDTGVYQQYASGVPGFNSKGIFLEPASTNKLTCYSANPTVTTGLTKAGDAAATLAVVDDTTALAAAGLANICSNGKVFKLDNTAGVATAWVSISGSTGNTNAHSFAAFIRGSGTVRLEFTSGGGSVLVTPASSYAYVKSANVVPADATRQLSVSCAAGAVAYFILPQLEELPYCTSPIVTAGASATRAETILSASGSNMRGNNMTFAMEVTPTAANFGTRGIFSITVDANNRYWLDLTGGNFLSLSKKVGGVMSTASKAIVPAVGTTFRIAARLSSVLGVDIFSAGAKGAGVVDLGDIVPAATIYMSGISGWVAPIQLRNFRIFYESACDATMQARTA